MGGRRRKVIIAMALAVACAASVSGCGSSGGEPAANTAAANTPPAGAVEKTPPALSLAKAIKHMASTSSDPRPTWGEWAITTLAEAASAFELGADVETSREAAEHPGRRVVVIMVHGTFENTRAPGGPPSSGSPPPVFAWYTSVHELDSKRPLTTIYGTVRPDTSSMGPMYVYSW
jgi:hypothetical protein